MAAFEESSVGDQGAAEVGEGLEVFGLAFVAANQASIVLQPGQARFDDPPVAAEAFGGLDAFAGDTHADAAPA